MKTKLNIGEKIRKLRAEKLMTQSELAGNQITRNMLSSIEHNQALPSVPTVIYLASRLNVSPGYLLSDEKDEWVYRKNQTLNDIKKAYKSKEYHICKQLCIENIEYSDDEIFLILSEACLKIAIEEFEKGNLRVSCTQFDEALKYSEKTAYNTEHIRQISDLYFGYLSKFSTLLYSNYEYDETKNEDLTYGFADFSKAFKNYDEGDFDAVNEYIEKNKSEENPYALFMSALMKEYHKDYKNAIEMLLALLNSQVQLNELMLYNIFDLLEKCYKEYGDYKSAYEYSQNKMRTYEHLLEN